MNQLRHETWQYIILWEFEVRVGKEKEFEKMYGSEGAWAQLFRRDDGYHGTELVRDAGKTNRYFTLDFWISQEKYEAFRKENREEYKAIDQECEALTHSEREIGNFVRTVTSPRKGYL
jgi:heme-degrading monooxygenase HmoA